MEGTIDNRQATLIPLNVAKPKKRLTITKGRCGEHMGSALDSGWSGLGSGPGQGHCVVFLGKTLCSHGASLHPSV